MEAWSAHQLSQEAEIILGIEKAFLLKQYAQNLIKSNLPVIFSLRHLSNITNVDYSALRATVMRKRESANYKMFAIKKRSGGRRFIHAVSGQLMEVQQFLNTEVLQRVPPHPASFAFHSQGGIRKCAAMHCGARWIFQYDIQDFFYSINEMNVCCIFKELGYRPLLAFELARICTTTYLPKHLSCLLHHDVNYDQSYAYYDRPGFVGVLPQGAPTSPMLSNLAARKLDEKLSEFAFKRGFVYTRYADDITISATRLPQNESIGKINRTIIGIIRHCKFRENDKKTRIAGPGSKKIVLGLLVDGEQPRISKEMYKRIDRHLYAVEKFGLAETALHERFDSAFGFHNHLSGLISFVKDVDIIRWNEFKIRIDRFFPSL